MFLKTAFSTRNLSLDISNANIYKVTNAKFSEGDFKVDENNLDFDFNEWYADVCFGEFIHNMPKYNLISCDIDIRIYKKYMDEITIDRGDTTITSEYGSFIDNKKYFSTKEMSDILDIVKSEVVPNFDYKIKDSKNYITIKLSMIEASKAEIMFALNMVRRFYRFNFASELKVAYDFYKDRNNNYFRKCSLIDILTIFDYFLFDNTYADDLLSNGSFGLPILSNKHAFTPECLHKYNYISEYLFHNVKYIGGKDFYPITDIKEPKDNPFDYDCTIDEYDEEIKINTLPIEQDIFQRLIIYRYKISNDYLYNSIEFNNDAINKDNIYKSYCYYFKKHINTLMHDFIRLNIISR